MNENQVSVDALESVSSLGKGLLQTSVAALIMAVVGLSYVHAFVYTRTEGTKLETQVQTNAETIRALDAKYDAKFDTIQQSLSAIQRDIGALLARQR